MADKDAIGNRKQKTLSKTILARQDDGTIQLTISIPQNLVHEKREEALRHTIEDLTVPGFRKGKAPQDVAMKHIDQQRLYEHMLEHLLPQVYANAIKEHSIRPILSPRFELLSVKEGQDWSVRATTCEFPEIDVGDYKKKVTGSLRSKDIWVPGSAKGKEDPKSKTPSREEKEQEVLKAVLESVKVGVPRLLIQEQVNHRLATLLDQVQKLGFTVEQYLKSTGKNINQVKEDYAKDAETQIKLELALNKIAEEENLSVEDSEIERVVSAGKQATGNGQVEKNLSDPRQRSLVRGVLLRRKALDRLVSLA